MPWARNLFLRFDCEYFDGNIALVKHQPMLAGLFLPKGMGPGV